MPRLFLFLRNCPSFEIEYGRGATKFNECDEKLFYRGECDGSRGDMGK
jgi:hypothetical protein